VVGVAVAAATVVGVAVGTAVGAVVDPTAVGVAVTPETGEAVAAVVGVPPAAAVVPTAGTCTPPLQLASRTAPVATAAAKALYEKSFIKKFLYRLIVANSKQVKGRTSHWRAPT
jgi:hypothetical protein